MRRKDTFSRKIVGWSIDNRQDSTLVVNALDMAIKNRKPPPGGIVHADHGVQGGFNWSKRHVAVELIVGVRPKLQRGFAIGVVSVVGC